MGRISDHCRGRGWSVGTLCVCEGVEVGRDSTVTDDQHLEDLVEVVGGGLPEEVLEWVRYHSAELQNI